MNKKIHEEILDKVEVMRIGAFTITRVTDIDGVVASGISRKSKKDRNSNTLGELIAKGRAMKALHLKKEGKKVRHPFMG